MLSAWGKSKKSFNRNSFNGLRLLLLLLITLRFLTVNNSYKNNTDPPSSNIDETDVFVQIEGDIKYPGVYSFRHHTDLNELITRGGGLNSKTVYKEAFNNISLESGNNVKISIDGGKPNIAVQEMTAFHKLTLGIPLSINRESEVGFTSLPGIGPVLAGEIVSKRERIGGFKKVNELLNVQGMGERKYSKIRSFIKE